MAETKEHEENIQKHEKPKKSKKKKKKKKKDYKKGKYPPQMITVANSAEMWDSYEPKTKNEKPFKINKRPCDDSSNDEEDYKENESDSNDGVEWKAYFANHTNKKKREKEEKIIAELKKLRNYKCRSILNKDGSIIFWPTPECKVSTTKLEKKEPISSHMEPILAEMMCKDPLCYSDIETKVIRKSQVCSFLVAALIAWSKHYPFRFKPDHIWLLILQGVAVHVDKNAEKLRGKYVSHDGKMKLRIDDVAPNPSRKEWMEIIQNFAAQIDKNTVNDTCELLECNFSTSTITEKLAAKVTIMDICKNYFDFRCSSQCGFPKISLDGSKDDWIKLKEKATKLLNEKVTKKFGEEWKKSLLPLLDRFICAFDGEIDCLFWNSMIKRGHVHGSGGISYYHGWINILFPFMKERKENEFNVPYSESHSYVKQGLKYNGIYGAAYGEMYLPDSDDEDGYDSGGSGDGPDIDDYPTGLASAPVIWDDTINLKVVAGFVGFRQDEKSLEITPNVAWCIAHAMSEKEFKEKYSHLL